MKKHIIALLAAALCATPAFGQSPPSLSYGQVLTPGQWASLFTAKNDTLGFTPLNVAGGVMLGRLVTAAPGATTAGLNLSCGTTPASPVNGDQWCTSAGLFVQINGATIGPLGGASSASFAATSPLAVTFPSGVVTYALNLANPNTWTGAQTFSGGATITGGSGAFTTALSFILSQNASTAINVSNTSTGTSAQAYLLATNSNDVGAFGVAGANFPTAGIQNRAYISAGSLLSGISLFNNGANPIDFYVNATRVGGFTSAGLFTLTTPLAVASGGTGIGSLGTGVATALGVNVGTAGAPVVNGGAGGTPSSITLTNGTGLPTTGLTGTLQAAQEPAHTGDVTNTAGSLALAYTNVVPATKGGAGTIAGALKGSGAGVVSQAACADLSNGGTACAQNYTQGTWTPAITASVTAGTPAYSVQLGTYEQIGRQVTVRFTINVSGWTGSPSGNTSIAGLPLTSANVANDDGVCHIAQYTATGLATSNVGISGAIAPNTTAILLFQASNTATSSITAAQLGTTPLLVGMCSYHT
jgi:hypothetical protein